jgi:hypothetical protein
MILESSLQMILWRGLSMGTAIKLYVEIWKLSLQVRGYLCSDVKETHYVLIIV